MTKENIPVEKNQFLNVIFEDLTHEGAGVAKVDGFPIFVPSALPGDEGQIKIIKVKKNMAFGRLTELTKPSEHRIDPICPIYKECGGCQVQHLSYEGQLQIKHKHVKDVMKRIGKLEDVTIHPVLGMENPWYYRNKVQVPFGEREGSLVAGFYAKRTHEIIDMDECFIQYQESDNVVQFIRDLCDRLGVPAYNEPKNKGVLRHVMTRYGHKTDEMMVVFITRTKDLPYKEEIIKELKKEFPTIKSIVQNINGKRTNVIFGDETKVLYGSEHIYDYIGDIKFAISARSFFQVNPLQTKVLYDKTLEYAELTGKEKVIDAYCGIGSISLFLAQKAKQVFGVEIVPEAIEDAKRNADLNEITNATFEVGKAEEVIPAWYKEGNEAEVIVVDPPRKGCDEELLQTMIEMKPKRIVYVSCNPSTLARDLRILEDGGYKTVEIQPVDMFPQTLHCENVAKLTLK